MSHIPYFTLILEEIERGNQSKVNNSAILQV